MLDAQAALRHSLGLGNVANVGGGFRRVTSLMSWLQVVAALGIIAA